MMIIQNFLVRYACFLLMYHEGLNSAVGNAYVALRERAAFTSVNSFSF